MNNETIIQIDESEVKRIQSLILIKLSGILLIKNSKKYKFEDTIQFHLSNKATIDFRLPNTHNIDAGNADIFSKQIWFKAFDAHKTEFEEYWRKETSLEVNLFPHANNSLKIDYLDGSHKYVTCYFENDKWNYKDYQ